MLALMLRKRALLRLFYHCAIITMSCEDIFPRVYRYILTSIPWRYSLRAAILLATLIYLIATLATAFAIFSRLALAMPATLQISCSIIGLY